MNLIKVLVENQNGILVTTSNRVAHELGVSHKHLLEKIEGYIGKFTKAETSALEEIAEKFSKTESSVLGKTFDFTEFYIPSSYKVKGNFKSYKNYLITEKGIAQLIGGYSAAVPICFYKYFFSSFNRFISKAVKSSSFISSEKMIVASNSFASVSSLFTPKR